MAKEKKVQTFTIEEKLEQALVPEGEQPYAIPENWVWVKLNSIGEIVTGATPSKKRADYYGGNFPFFKPADLNQGRNVYEASDYLTTVGKGICRIIPSQSTVVCCIGTIGKCGFLMCEGTTNQQINSIIPQINPLLVYYYCCTEMFLNQLNSVASATTISIVNKSKMSSCSFPLPPLAEQRRIVSRIESLFEKLDHARELVQSALDSFETRKASILHKAFTGELTAKWREKNGVELESWVEKRLGDCGLLERGRSKHRPRNASELFGGPYPFIQTGDVANADVYITKHNQTLSEIGLNQSKLFPKGTLCITIAANIGDVAILSYDSCFPDSVVGFTPNEYTNSKFVYYLMNILQKQLEAEAPATAQKNINLKVLNEITFRCPRIIEQQEIVRILDNLLEKEQQTQEQLEPILDQIDMMKKSILARAFRGELGTNDPSEESAMEFLKEILVKGNQS
jgi:type I restriction enzyme S subunit